MNANYQHLSIPAAALLLVIFVVAFVIFRTQSPSTDPATETNADSTIQTSTDDASFEPFQASEDPSHSDNSQNTISTKTSRKSRPARFAQLQHHDQFTQFPRNAPRPLDDLESAIPEPELTPEAIRQRREQRWMAKISAQQVAEIDAVIDAAEQRHIETVAKNVNRRAAIETVDYVTQICFEELYTRASDAAGRIIVNFEIKRGLSDRGIFENVHIASNYNLNDMAFEACIVAAVDSVARHPDIVR